MDWLKLEAQGPIYRPVVGNLDPPEPGGGHQPTEEAAGVRTGAPVPMPSDLEDQRVPVADYPISAEELPMEPFRPRAGRVSPSAFHLVRQRQGGSALFRPVPVRGQGPVLESHV